MAVGAALAAASSLGAQVVRGTVTMPDGVTRAAGVIIAIAGDTGAPLRTLTGTRGTYLITLRRAGSYTLRALRVGFRPTEQPPFTIGATDTLTLDIRLTGAAVSLAAVTVKGDDVCRTRPDSGALVARAWDEARKAILSAGLTAGDAPLVAEWIEYTRTLDATSRLVRGLRVKTTTNPTTHAFRSVPAESLAARGYVVADGEETTYHAPDGDVLLSDAFASTHCFQIVASPRGADSLVGVGFRPSNDRRDVREIEGTFWLDRKTAELRWMDFTYTNMPAIADKAGAGGRVEFLHTGTGNWLIGKWSIRMPEFGRSLQQAGAVAMRLTKTASITVVKAIQMTGGEVTRVTRGDTLVYQAQGAVLEMRVMAADTLIRADGARVRLVGTDYVAIADASGRARLTPVLEGRYEAQVSTPLLDSLHVTPQVHEVEVSLAPRRDSVRLPTAEAVLRRVCKDSVRAGDGMARGMVRDSLGNPLIGVAVSVTWQGRAKAIGSGVQWSEQSIGALTDDDGLWRVCGVPRAALLVVRAGTDQLTDAQRLTIPSDAAFGSVLLVPHATAATIDRTVPKPERALVEFGVLDEGGFPVPGVSLEIELPNGTRTLTTGDAGKALLTDVVPGRLIVRARRVGLRPGQVMATVEAGRNTVPIIMSAVSVPQLNAVRIVGDQRRATGRLDEFETRRLNGAATRSITREEIVQRNPTATWQLLTNVRGMKVGEVAGAVYAITSRVDGASLLSPKACYMRVMVDGTILPDERPDLTQLPRPEEIHGIEVFAGPASIPVQYGGAGAEKWCGIIAIWTR